MRHPARWIAGTAAVVVVAFSIVLATQVGNDPLAESKRSQLTGKAVPSFQVETLDGTTITEATFVGKAVIVNFWNTWCIPCIQEHPVLQQFAARHVNDADFLMIGIVRDDTRAAVRRWVERYHDPWTIAFDPEGNAALAFGTRGQPETFAISPNGVIVGYQYGPASLRGLEAMLGAARGL